MAGNSNSGRAPILVCLDFSPGSDSAFAWAVEAALAFDVRLIALHVVHDPADAPGFYVRPKMDKVEEFERVAQEMMDEFIAAARKQNPRFDDLRGFESIIVTGLPVSRILEIAEREAVGMIAMGAQGRTALADLVLGSHVERVTRLAPVTITVVKPRPQAKS